MPIVGSHEKRVEEVLTPRRIAMAVVLTHERPGYLTRTLESLRKASPWLKVVVYDDGSDSDEKLEELQFVEENGYHVNYGVHRGFVRTWMQVFFDISRGIDNVYDRSDGIVLLEDDLIFAKGWDGVLLAMAAGVEALGLRPGAMTCFRCHGEPQNPLVNLNGVMAYQTMQHGFQLNMFPAWVFDERKMLEEAADNSENGEHGIDIWLMGLMAHRLGLTSFMSEQSWVAHVGASQSLVESQGFRSFKGVGYNLVKEFEGSL